jgi:hypothetical protein
MEDYYVDAHIWPKNFEAPIGCQEICSYALQMLWKLVIHTLCRIIFILRRLMHFSTRANYATPSISKCTLSTNNGIEFKLDWAMKSKEK